jgi:cytochrome b6-f complex iron-sulfur subunit
MNRRNFIGTACLVCTGAGISWLLQACTSHRYISDFTIAENKLTVKKTSFTLLKKEKAIQQKYVLLKPEQFQFPIALYKLNENEYQAVLLQCTHQGCELTAYENMMVCPCHGAEFNTKGKVTQGPADIDLKIFKTSHDQENIYIQF